MAHDRNFALAHAALASAYTQRIFYEATDPVFEQKAFLEIERSLAINPDQAEAYLARAQLAWNLRNGFPHERAITDLRRALSINPNLADAFIELGKVYYHVGQTDKAVDASDQAQRLDPSSVPPANRRIGALLDAGRVEEVRHELDRHGTRLTPIFALTRCLRSGDRRRLCRRSWPRGHWRVSTRNPSLAPLPCWQWCTPDLAEGRTLSASWPKPSLSRKIRRRSPTCITRSLPLAARLAFSAATTRRCAGSLRPQTRVTHRIRGSQQIKASRL